MLQKGESEIGEDILDKEVPLPSRGKKGNPTLRRIELRILRLTVVRLNQLGHRVNNGNKLPHSNCVATDCLYSSVILCPEKGSFNLMEPATQLHGHRAKMVFAAIKSGHYAVYYSLRERLQILCIGLATKLRIHPSDRSTHARYLSGL